MDEVVDGVRYTWIAAPRYTHNDWRRLHNMVGFAWNALRLGRRLPGRPDCIVGSSPQPLAAKCAQILARYRKCGYALELRDLWPQVIVDMGAFRESSPLVRMARLLEHTLYQGCHPILVFAAGMKGYLAERGVSSSRIYYIPTGANVDEYVPSWAHGIDGLQPDECGGQITVMYTGAHGPANGLQVVVEAADILRDSRQVRFVLLGDGPDKESLRAEAVRRHLGNIQFWDAVPKAEVPKLLASADIGLITLRNVAAFEYAISPNKLFEYMSAGLPVLCAIPGDMSRLVQEAGSGVVIPPEDPVALAEAVLMLAGMTSEERIEIGKRGRRLVEERFDRRVLVDEFERVVSAVTCS